MTTPFKMLEIVMLHQMPLSPRNVWISTIAIGTRNAENTILFTEGGMVFP